MTAAPHPECPQCAQTAALAAEMRDRLDAVTRILIPEFEREGLVPPVALRDRRPVKVQPPARPSLTVLPGGGAMTAKPRKISDKQLQAIQENSRRNWNKAVRQAEKAQGSTSAPSRRRRSS